ncbi:PD-(D/E)XK nuclease family transposase, partial [Allochromatium warmingii]
LLLDHGGIWLLELNKFHADTIENEQQRWLKFFKDGEQLDADALPTWMQTDEMRQAMSTLKAFSEKDRAYHAYQARQNYLREQRGIQRHIDELKAEAEQARVREEQERAAKEAALKREAAALAELERLKAQLHGQQD